MVVDQNRCIACSACFEICVHDAISMVFFHGRDYAYIEKKECMRCRDCVDICPVDAIGE